MRIVAYGYSDPILEPAPDENIWGWEVDRVYQDRGSRRQRNQFLQDNQTELVDYLLVRSWEELDNSVAEMCCRFIPNPMRQTTFYTKFFWGILPTKIPGN